MIRDLGYVVRGVVTEFDRAFSIGARYVRYYQCAQKNGDVLINGWRFNRHYGMIYLCESRGSWRNYLTPDLLGDVVDVGAGCAETVKFFLDKGARSVVAVENNPLCFPYLKENAARHGFKVWLEDFKPEKLLTLKFNTLKLDIEGYELLLLPYLNYLQDVNIVLESHCNYITKQFLEHGFSKRDVDHWGVGCLYRWRR